MNVKKQEKEGTILWIGFLSFLRLSGEKKKKSHSKRGNIGFKCPFNIFQSVSAKDSFAFWIHVSNKKKKVQAYLTVISTDLGSDVKYNLWPCSKWTFKY